jgi:hypothetical protein
MLGPRLRTFLCANQSLSLAMSQWSLIRLQAVHIAQSEKKHYHMTRTNQLALSKGFFCAEPLEEKAMRVAISRAFSPDRATRTQNKRHLLASVGRWASAYSTTEHRGGTEWLLFFADEGGCLSALLAQPSRKLTMLIPPLIISHREAGTHADATTHTQLTDKGCVPFQLCPD